MKSLLVATDIIKVKLNEVHIECTFKRIQGVSKICYNPGNSTLLFCRLVLFFSGCLTRDVINAARIVSFKSTIKLNKFSSDKKHNL